MSLDNLLRIGRLHTHATDRREIGKLLAGAERNLRDAETIGISNSTRFTLAYTAIMQSDQVALFANGYRPSTSSGGHHMTMVQALVHSIGLEPARMQVLDAHRRKRNVIDYSGEDAEPSEAEAAVTAARALLKDVRAWLKTRYPDLT